MSLELACTISATSSRALLDVDLDRVGVVGQVAGDVLGDGQRSGAADAVAFGADLVVDAVALGRDLVFEVVVVGVVVLFAHAVSSVRGVLGGGLLGGGPRRALPRAPRREPPRSQRPEPRRAGALVSLTFFSDGATLPVA